MTIPTATGLEAAQTWRNLADLWPLLHAYLEPRKSGADTVRTPPASKPPMSLVASDLIQELENMAWGFTSQIMDETHDFTPAPTTPQRMHQIAERHGHFTTSEETRTATRFKDGKPYKVTILLAQDFCDDTHELMRKAVGLIEKPVPPTFAGPCMVVGCDGDLYVKPGRAAATCVECAADVDLGQVREQLRRAMGSRLMRRKEIAPALRMLGANSNYEAVKKWVQRGRLVPVIREPEMFRLTDAMDLAKIEVAA